MQYSVRVSCCEKLRVRIIFFYRCTSVYSLSLFILMIAREKARGYFIRSRGWDLDCAMMQYRGEIAAFDRAGDFEISLRVYIVSILSYLNFDAI